MSVKVTGSCFCRAIQYSISLSSPDEARTSICHCGNCKKFTGSANGITTKIPKSAFTLTQGTLKIHQGDNGSGSRLTREFCGECGSGILEYGESAGDNIYVFYGTQDDLDVLPPKGEFFCSQRCSWLPEVPGVFHKQKIKE